MSNVFPMLKIRARERALREAGTENIEKIIVAYLFNGMAYRKIDSEVLGLSVKSIGYASMGVVHHFGLHDEHKGIFKDTKPADAFKILEAHVPALIPYITNLKSAKDGLAVKDAVINAYEEGNKRLKTHLTTERNSSVIKDAKAAFVKQHGHLYCEVCGFDFEKVYGVRGDGFIEGHHKQPISQHDGTVKTTINDIAMVCSNCHSMLHRTPFLSIEELRSLIHK